MLSTGPRQEPDGKRKDLCRECDPQQEGGNQSSPLRCENGCPVGQAGISAQDVADLDADLAVGPHAVEVHEADGFSWCGWLDWQL